MGRVSFSALGSGFRVFDFARVGFRVLEYLLIHLRVKLGSKFFAFFSQFWLDLAKNLLRVTRVLQNSPWVCLGL